MEQPVSFLSSDYNAMLYCVPRNFYIEKSHHCFSLEKKNLSDEFNFMSIIDRRKETIMYKPTPRTMLYEEVINQILTLIKDGKWTAGEKIPTEQELSKYFQVSRNSVREALKVLEHLKIISSKAGSGTFVLEESIQNIQVMELIDTLRKESTYESLMDTRLIIEPELTYRAALTANEEEINNLEKIIENSMQAVEKGEYFTPTVGFSFHMKLAEMSKNAILYKFLESITLELISLRKVIMKNHNKEDLLKEISEHKKIFAYIKKKQPEEAKKAMYQHLKNAENHLENYK